MSTVMTEKTKVHDLMLYETDQRYVRDEVTFRNNTGATATFEIGTTLITSTGKRVPAPDNDADGILLERVVDLANNTDAPRKVAILKKGPAIVNQDVLAFIAAADAGNQTAQKADLEALGIRLISEPTKQTSGADD